MLDYSPEHSQFRELVRDFVQQTVVPAHERWEKAGRVDRSLFTEAGKLGLLGFSVPEEFGGPGVDDFRYNAILVEELQRAGAAAEAVAFSLQNDIVLPYLTDLTTPEQKQRWLPGVVTGETIVAIAMTEPGAGSDLAGIRTTAVRDGDHYVVNGAKTFISNGQIGDLFVVAVRTAPDRHKGLSLLVIDPDTPGFSRGRNLEKIGLHAQDTSELSFDDVRVPVENLLEAEGRGFYQLMNNLPQERLSLGVGAVAAAEGVLAETLEYVRERQAFGSPIAGLQNTQFLLAELATELDVARTYLDDCIAEHLAGGLTAARAARLKWWTTELQVRVADRCLQLHGGYGYMREYPVSRAFVDARIQTIYGGTTEIMKTIIAKDLGL
ncbi:acyl-CoA dehydrogenase family protein [Mycobacterium shimoidei]|uniref:acyl-CoA dehydrogenase family protein n=1 Tax=Mycobacterium shimoidei TaxID=29313 RepID=UPI0008491CE9|nr:acyl-CoA dehydrogenase family protein [Mycobacterium shimoidei]MCV7257689.1 acyl-CoA dehydrogenase family protein [Mycobacterium shimoidei]ODR13405.1 acyl-CoA dehydrogenase [Mycobacterium shimoidei]ORW81554.1 acyl-CoA dehydrogenase [Mycobacterium shimoidei]